MTKFYFAESQIFIRYSSKLKNYNVCSMKLVTKVMHLQNIGFEDFFVFVNKYAVNDFRLFSHVHIDCTSYVSISQTCLLRCIITTYYIHAIVN